MKDWWDYWLICYLRQLITEWFMQHMLWTLFVMIYVNYKQGWHMVIMIECFRSVRMAAGGICLSDFAPASVAVPCARWSRMGAQGHIPSMSCPGVMSSFVGGELRFERYWTPWWWMLARTKSWNILNERVWTWVSNGWGNSHGSEVMDWKHYLSHIVIVVFPLITHLFM